MGEVTIILKDEKKRSELVDLLATLPYVESVQFEGNAREAANRKDQQRLPGNGRSASASDRQRNDVLSQADPLDREVAFFEEQHEQLVKAFLGQYIAMYQGAHYEPSAPVLGITVKPRPAANQPTGAMVRVLVDSGADSCHFVVKLANKLTTVPESAIVCIKPV